MSTRKSLHIGLNRVDPDQYGGWDGALSGCINDADAMKEIAESRGFTAEQLIDDQATVGAVRDKLNEYASQLEDGDFLFLTYSGHGGQVPDQNGDEIDGYDETWCLYDTELVDDSLYGALCTFKKGVRIFIMSDSCHSETVARRGPGIQRIAAREERRAFVDNQPGPKSKRAPLEFTTAEYEKNQQAYKAQQGWWAPKQLPDADVPAKVVLISGCRDEQTSMDGPGNGAFTYAFLQVWEKNGRDYRKGYKDLQLEVLGAIENSDQEPQIFYYGEGVKAMLAQMPFSDENAAVPV
ncbi:caspase family protein [Mycobacterium sp. URHB0044]|uniref:caspase family protein n=1 Tax=Mycobacterium sp. URHB0044 TaxID=1380386 RepID=UPI000569CB76|nr:caspase family protein [Mycobacterium sp. URHB0044]